VDQFWMLVERFRADLVNQALAMLGSQQDAEDVAQEALCQAFLNLNRLREPAKLGKWMRGINRNLALNFRRRRGQAREERLATAQADALEAPLEEAAPPGLGELGRNVVKAVDALPEPFREVLVHRYWEKLSTEQIAVRLGVPPGTVRSRLSRAFRHLARRLKTLPQNQEPSQ
jgi:RNA polymerase sigma-70 factor (ECF subfamily)